MKPSIINFALLIVSAVALSACGPQNPPPILPRMQDETTQPSTAVALQDQLRDQQFSTLDKPFKDRVRAPNISSLEQNPVAALGIPYVRIAKANMECNSSNADDFEYRRLESLSTDKCESARTYPARSLSLKHVKGNAAADIAWVVGAVAMSADYMFKLAITEPVAAAYEGNLCLDAVKVAKLKLPDRTCEVHYIVGAVLTQVTFERFKQVQTTGDAAFSIVKVGGKAYGSDADTENKIVLTVDAVDISANFTLNKETGFLVTEDPIQRRTSAIQTKISDKATRLLLEQK